MPNFNELLNQYQQIVQQQIGQQQQANPFAQLGGAGIPLAAYGLLGGGKPATTWRDHFGIAERRALKLFKDMYGKKRLWRYLRDGYVEFHAKDGRTYRVFRQRHQSVEVYQRMKTGKKLLYKLCLVDTEKIPLTDGVLKRLWLLRCDPNALHEQANVVQ